MQRSISWILKRHYVRSNNRRMSAHSVSTRRKSTQAMKMDLFVVGKCHQENFLTYTLDIRIGLMWSKQLIRIRSSLDQMTVQFDHGMQQQGFVNMFSNSLIQSQILQFPSQVTSFILPHGTKWSGLLILRPKRSSKHSLQQKRLSNAWLWLRTISLLLAVTQSFEVLMLRVESRKNTQVILAGSIV